MKFPYGLCGFKPLITKGYFYCDRTDRISLIEDTGKSSLFLRPRRLGKSLLLSMLENYYDVARKDQFEEIFGHLLIGKNPTPSRNKYFILKWDFSCINPMGNAENTQRFLYDHVNTSVEKFKIYYGDYLTMVVVNLSVSKKNKQVLFFPHNIIFLNLLDFQNNL